MEPFLWCGIGFFLSDRESRVLSRPRRALRRQQPPEAARDFVLLTTRIVAASAGATRRAGNGASAAAARLLLSVLRFVLPWFLVLQTISCLQISESEGFYLLTIESVYYHVNSNKKE